MPSKLWKAADQVFFFDVCIFFDLMKLDDLFQMSF